MKWLFFVLATSLFSYTDLAVTYEFSKGRFGDNLLAYLHAKWFAYQRNIPLLYKSFPLSSQLVMHKMEKPYGAQFQQQAYTRHYLARGPINPGIRLPILYICPYFPEDPWELDATLDMGGNEWYHFDVDWKDPVFRAMAREMIAPAHPLSLVNVPQNTVNIALHVREGGGYDGDDGYLYWPLKIPPLTYYIEALRKTLAFLPPGKEVFCYLFTDAGFPQHIAERIQEAVGSNLTIRYRRINNHHTRNVLEDFFSLFKFDILIRSQSNYSLVPTLIHDFAIYTAPKDFIIFADAVTITKFDFVVNEEALGRALNR
ncbi:MAG: hypothetical protein KGJ02_04750 [Verrucomicrobiota bacterium]|nr:hypothetical protein [Verrucomicrobiota bacterium]